MAAHIAYGRGFFLTAKRFAGTLVGKKIRATIESIASDWPELPREGDAEYFLPPVRKVSSRRVAGTTHMIVYAANQQGIVILAVATGT